MLMESLNVNDKKYKGGEGGGGEIAWITETPNLINQYSLNLNWLSIIKLNCNLAYTIEVHRMLLM